MWEACALQDAVLGLCNYEDKRNLVPLYRVLGHWDMHTIMSLEFQVSVSFVGVQCKLERAYASTRA